MSSTFTRRLKSTAAIERNTRIGSHTASSTAASPPRDLPRVLVSKSWHSHGWVVSDNPGSPVREISPSTEHLRRGRAGRQSLLIRSSILRARFWKCTRTTHRSFYVGARHSSTVASTIHVHVLADCPALAVRFSLNDFVEGPRAEVEPAAAFPVPRIASRNDECQFRFRCEATRCRHVIYERGRRSVYSVAGMPRRLARSGAAGTAALPEWPMLHSALEAA